MSPFAWHAAARTQTLPWQFVEQHSLPCAHTSRSVLQESPPGPGATASHVPPAPQIVEQHCVPEVHCCPTDEHRIDPQCPPVQVPVQHSVASMQTSLGSLHWVGFSQKPV